MTLAHIIYILLHITKEKNSNGEQFDLHEKIKLRGDIFIVNT